MGNLNDILMKDGVRDRVIADCAVLIDEEVSDKRGISGMGIKAGYKFVKKLRADFVPDALDSLIDEFIDELNPFYDEHGKVEGFGAFMVNKKARVADGLLGVTDRRRDRTSHRALKKAYTKLRPIAKSNVEQAIPRLSRLVQKHLDKEA